MTRGPGVGEKFVHVGRARGQAVEHVTQIRPGIQALTPGAGANAHQHARRLQAAVAADVQPVVAADRQRADGAFGRAVVDGEPRVIEITNQRPPLVAGTRMPPLLDAVTSRPVDGFSPSGRESG
jgi:hypothetical protein